MLLYNRAEEASSKHWTLSRMFRNLLIVFMFVYITSIYTAQKDVYKYKPIYPHWKKKQPAFACGVTVQNDPIIKVNNLKTFMVGSYIEHRKEVKMIRTITIMFRSENAEYHCLLCCNGLNVSVPATRDIHSDHFGFEYGTAYVTCKVPETCTKPTHVAITSRSPEEDGSLQDIQAFQPVRNQEEKKDFPYDFTVCISVMYDYDNVLELVQAMEMFKILGVQKVAIYKTNCTSDTQKVLDYYVRQNFVEIIPWNLTPHNITVSRGWKKSDSPGELHYFGQIPALNDCVYRYMYQSRYVALQNLEELILPMKSKNWPELLPELERQYGQMGSFEFENHYFPLSIKDSSAKYSPDSWKKVRGVNILEHITRISNDPNQFNNIKVIVNPRLVFKATVHGIFPSINGSVRVDPGIARMYNMRSIPNEIVAKRFQIRDPHLRDYAESLIPVVSKVLEEALGDY
ncbi:hypothetical protein PHYPO_G00217210 [Pangasianodon hypophthalmus]|uniref:Glycosyltransferase family 92 protein n=1 Tax=Pangasianodon hypophthalmus TaxID=310915 RepID=A0A5N5P683_PANHP|nr:hypothetical protein PHYPO_G00217210 [Pangasianodon hypophthalmus]